MFRRRQENEGEGSHPGLTYDVRYALKHRDALLSPNDIVGLFANKLGNVGFYMTMKACEHNDGLQTELLETAASYDFELARFTRSDVSRALGHLASQENPFVNGQKLNPIRSLGVSNWTSRFTDVLEPVLAERPEASLFLVANAPYVGLDKAAFLTVMRNRRLGILKPSRFEQDDKPIGFMLEPSSSGVDIYSLGHDFTRPERAIIFDDALNSGAVRRRVIEFWSENTLPNFVTAFVDKRLDSTSKP